MASELITAVIPTYNRSKLLRRAVLSVLGQRYPHVQVCIWDNASDDETEAMVAGMFGVGSRVQYYRREKNVGFINNLNHGLTEVKTPYFCVLADDDLLFPWFLESAMSGFAQHPDAMFSALDSIKVDEASSVMAGPVLVGEGDDARRFALINGSWLPADELPAGFLLGQGHR